MRPSITTFIRQSSSLVISLLLCSCSTRIDTARLNLAEQSIPKSLPLDLVNKIIIQENAISAVRNPFSTLRRGLSFSHNRALLLAAPIPGRLNYLIAGPAFFPALHDSVGNATQSVETRMYIFGNDNVATRYSDLLKKKSASRNSSPPKSEASMSASFSARETIPNFSPSTIARSPNVWLKMASQPTSLPNSHT